MHVIVLLINVNTALLVYACRFDVKELLQNDFFLEDTGLKVELVGNEGEEQTNTIQLRLRVVDPK